MSDDAQLKSQVDSRTQQVNTSIGNTKAALKTCLDNPPVTAQDPAIKEKNAETVFFVLNTIKDKDIDSHVDSLSPEELDVLMKYVYRLMNTPDSHNPQHMLRWHASVLRKGGKGTIVRAMTDRRTV